ncbi:MAG: ABC transporter substrate-binding protein [Burkholderiales bacterium]|nr:ABC transporter substrate-binding protein [Burkholderiales bacterium]MDE2393855.1 ABC transporter substrate-binding protein [Burkholderiales bacterium]MDE2455932.1 ABC transporter substrate-binding protein [Burkholderiales bacterium]
MTHPTRRGLLAATLGTGLALAVATRSAHANPPPTTLIVGSANFPESVLLAQIYADALKAKGVAVSTRLNIASRETYLGALADGSIDLIPEYTGNLARYYDKAADIADPAAALAALKKALPAGFTVLAPSAAQDSDSICVAAATAKKYALVSIADLAGHAKDMVIGGPPEFKQRVDGLPGLQRVYGLVFKSFLPFDSANSLTVTALKNGQVQAANLYTTDPQVAANGFVALQDPKHLFGAQNVIPLIRRDHLTDAIASILDAVSAKLDTATLAALVKNVVIDKQDVAAVARAFLASKGLS